MTFDDAKDMLADIKGAKRRALNIRRDIKDLEMNIDALILKPALGGERVQSQTSESTVERVVLRLERLRDRFAQALEEIMDLEDKLCAAIEQLNPVEKDVIIGYYLRDKTHDQLARECHYGDRHIMRIKRRAIEKISQKL